MNLKDNNYFNTFFLLFIFLSSIFTSILKSCIPRINNLRFLIQSQLHHSTKVVTTRKFPQILFNDYELNPMFPPFFFFFVFFLNLGFTVHKTTNFPKEKKMQLKTIRLKKNDMWKKTCLGWGTSPSFLITQKNRKRQTTKKKTNSNPTYFFFSLQNWISPNWLQYGTKQLKSGQLHCQSKKN